MNIGPYAVVIRDSFHAALSSRVLWIAVIAIWLWLALLAPFGVREDFTTRFRAVDFLNGTRMKAMLAKGLVDPEGDQMATGRIARALPPELKRKLQLVGEGEEVRISYSVLIDALNSLFSDDDWYDAKAWASTVRLRELRQLDAETDEQLTPSLRDRRTRLRVEAALPGVFETRASRSILLTYAGVDFPASWGWVVEKPQFETLVNQFVLPIMIDWLLGFVLILLGILVTASIIPDMLQPGSLHLLLSKPISRVLLLLSKFVGGLAFVFLCVVQLVVGLYLIAGTRLEIWNPRLLWCIPVSVFLFAVFYSVSVLAGLLWRSPIMAISVTVIFGGLCFIVGFIGSFFDSMVKDPYRLTHLAIAGEDLFATTRGGGFVRFDENSDRWVDVYKSGPLFINANRVLSPIALDDDHVVTAQIQHGRLNPFGSGAPELLVLSRAKDWEPEPSLRLPTATTGLFAGGTESVLALTTAELSMTSRQQILSTAGLETATPHSNGQTSSKQDRSQNVMDKETQPDTSQSSEPAQGWLSKLQSMIGVSTEGFSAVLPAKTSLSPPRSIAFDRRGDALVACSQSRLIRVERPQKVGSETNRWQLASERLLEVDGSKQTRLALSGNRLLLIQPGEAPWLLDAVTLETRTQLKEPKDDLKSILGLQPDTNGQSRFLAITEGGNCILLESNILADGNEVLQRTRSIGPSRIECVLYDAARKQIVFAHHIDEIALLDAGNFETKKRIRPTLKVWRRIDAWLITPLRYLLPQTSELSQTISAMISGKSTFSLGNGIDDDVQIQYEITRPIVTCAVFTVAMLMISCVYFSRRDF